MHPTDTPRPMRPPQRPAPVRRYRRPFATLRTVTALMLREMATTYGRSPGGFLWVVLEPVAGVALLSAIFSLAVRTPALGSSFPLYYATGFVPFFGFLTLQTKIAASLPFSKPLLAYPSVTWIDAMIARFVLNWLADVLVAVIVFGGILLLFEPRSIIHYPTVFSAMVMLGALAFGVGAMNCYLFLRVPLWQRAFAIAMRPMFFLSCVFFLFESMPQPYRDWLWWNPLVHVVGLMRRGFYASYEAAYVSPLYVYGLSALLAAFALLLLRSSYRDLLDR